MGRRAAAEEENHWPGFVDALSTIVMVVTFLLIILVIVIFVLSQRMVAKSYIESQTEIQQSGGGDLNNPNKLSASNEFNSPVETDNEVDNKPPVTAVAQTEIESQEQSKAQNQEVVENQQQPESQSQEQSSAQEQQQNASAQVSSQAVTQSSDIEPIEEATITEQFASEDNADGRFKPQLGEKLTAEEEPESEQKLAILTRPTEIEEKKEIVAPPDRSEEEKPVEVQTSSNAILELKFDKASIKIDDKTLENFGVFKGFDENRRLSIWSFTGRDSKSITEDKRIAYYRALAARNELLKQGVKQENISVEVRYSGTDEQKNILQIVEK